MSDEQYPDTSIVFHNAASKRACGGCTLCCKLLPVRELDKPAGTRCRHQRTGKGCAVYRRPGMPPSCHVWSCRWLTNEGTEELSCPDRSHYVIDVMPDYVTLQYPGEPDRHVPVLQVWVDPNHPEAHRDPALRRFLARMGEEHGFAAIIRYSSSEGFTVFPPALTGRGWHEEEGQKGREADFADTLSVLATGRPRT